MKTNLYLWSYPARFFLEREMFHTKFEKKRKHIPCSINFFDKKFIDHKMCVFIFSTALYETCSKNK
jgi:hypothetical protein